MIEGSIDEFGRPLIDVTVFGNRAQATVSAAVDTGFGLHLSLPVEVAVGLGLELSTFAEFELADGTVNTELVFDGQVQWDGAMRNAEMLVTFSADALIGIPLLEGYDVHLDFRNRRMTIE